MLLYLPILNNSQFWKDAKLTIAMSEILPISTVLYGIVRPRYRKWQFFLVGMVAIQAKKMAYR
jgi:hypothetical protein